MKLLYIDTETSGLDPIADAVIQIAGIVEIDGEVKEEFELKTKPHKGDCVSKQALAVNGVKFEDLQTYPEPAVTYGKFKSILDKYIDKYDRKDKFYIVGQNVPFDYEFLRWFFRKNGDHYLGSYIHYHKIDLIAITTIMKIAGRISLENMKLESVMAALDLGKQTHDALDDVRAVRTVFYKYVSMINGMMS